MKKTRMAVVSGIIFIALAICIPEYCYPQKPDKSEIISRVKELENAHNRADARAYAAVYAENGVHTYANGVTHRGRKAIEEGITEMFAGPMKGTQMKINPENIQFITDDVAVEEASFVLSGLRMPDGTAMPAIQGICLAVYQKQEKEWYAVAVQCMVPPVP
jgi:uncharacterized protein (TIGR02246 family)